MNVEQGFQLKDLRGIVQRRWPVVAAVLGLVFLLSLLLASWLPNQYAARTTVLVEPQVISKRLVETGFEKSDLNERLHLMTMQILSRGRLSKIIDDLKLYPEESDEMTREEVIELMRGRIRVEPVLPELEAQQQTRRQGDYEINTFRLYFVADDANTAAAVANRLSNDFIEEHIKERVQISGDTSEFIESELNRLNSRMAQVDARIAQLKSENSGRLPDDLDGNQRILERALDNLRSAQRELALAESDEAFYKQQALASGGGEPNDESSPARRLEDLRQQLGSYRSHGFTDKHPDVMANLAEIDELQKRVDGKAGQAAAPTSLAQQNAEAERRRASLRITSTNEEIKRLSAQVEEVQARINDTPRVQEQLSQLEVEAKHLIENFADFSDKRLEAGVAANMERRQKGEMFRVLEPAVPPPSPASPNRVVIVLVGLMLGIALGAGLGILLESADSSFHGARELQAQLRIPVLAAIPAITLDADRALRRRHTRRIGVATAAVVGTVLLMSAGGYAFRSGFFAGKKPPAVSPAPATPAAPAPAAGGQAPVAPPPAIPDDGTATEDQS